MLVYRITTKKWADSLKGSGIEARWNSAGIPMLYTASSRSLACLENLVHRQSIGNSTLFRVITIFLPDTNKQMVIKPEQLPTGWFKVTDKSLKNCRAIGDEWYRSCSSLYLKTPSAIIPEEDNILINPTHPAFIKVKIMQIEPFVFDERIAKSRIL